MIVVAVAFEVESIVQSLGRYAMTGNFDVMYTKEMQARAMTAMKTETQQRH